jgi:hypothetical protein
VIPNLEILPKEQKLIWPLLKATPKYFSDSDFKNALTHTIMQVQIEFCDRLKIIKGEKDGRI